MWLLVPLLFSIYLNDLFFFLQGINICTFADDMVPFVRDITFVNVLANLEGLSELAIFWFKNNYMKLNTDKCHLLVSLIEYKHGQK